MSSKLFIKGKQLSGAVANALRINCNDKDGNKSNVQKELDKIQDNLNGLRFGVDGEGNYGYLGADDSFIPFKSFNFNVLHHDTSYVSTLSKEGLIKGRKYLLLMTSYSGSGSSYALNNYCIIGTANGCTYEEVQAINDTNQGACRVYLLTTIDTAISITCGADSVLYTLIG